MQAYLLPMMVRSAAGAADAVGLTATQVGVWDWRYLEGFLRELRGSGMVQGGIWAGIVTKWAAGGGGSGGVLRIVKAAVAAREAGNLACTLVDGAYLTAVLAGDERDVGVWERLHGYVVNRRIPGAVGAAAGAAEVVVLGVVAKDFVSRVSCVFGTIGVLLPHHFWYGNIGENHLALEYLRLYSASLLTSSYLLFTLSTLKSPQTRLHITRSFAILYSLHFIVLCRAQLTGGKEHGWMGWMGVIISAVLAGIYG
ncbi:hypothetical protein TrRE_jg11823, partial [Triparma retinervis]